MSLGGRPKEEEGHTPKRVSLDQEACKGLEKISIGERSKFIEKALRPLLKQLDPGESCKFLGLLDRVLDCGISSALSKQDYEKATTLATVADSLAPFRNLCRVSDENNSVQSGKRELGPIERHKNVSCRRIMDLLE